MYYPGGQVETYDNSTFFGLKRLAATTPVRKFWRKTSVNVARLNPSGIVRNVTSTYGPTPPTINNKMPSQTASCRRDALAARAMNNDPSPNKGPRINCARKIVPAGGRDNPYWGLFS